jgi:hypothetical protein
MLLWTGILKDTKLPRIELLDYSTSPGDYGVHYNRVDEDLSAYGMSTHAPNEIPKCYERTFILL